MVEFQTWSALHNKHRGGGATLCPQIPFKTTRPGFGCHRPRGLMDKASDFESEDCGFESRRGQVFYWFYLISLWTPELRPIVPAVTHLALLALWLAFPAVTPQHSYDSPPTNGKAPRAPLASTTAGLARSFIS